MVARATTPASESVRERAIITSSASARLTPQLSVARDVRAVGETDFLGGRNEVNGTRSDQSAGPKLGDSNENESE